jgi:hypothetical protein
MNDCEEMVPTVFKYDRFCTIAGFTSGAEQTLCNGSASTLARVLGNDVLAQF